MSHRGNKRSVRTIRTLNKESPLEISAPNFYRPRTLRQGTLATIRKKKVRRRQSLYNATRGGTAIERIFAKHQTLTIPAIAIVKCQAYVRGWLSRMELKRLKKMKEERTKIAFELLETEKTYVKGLKDLCYAFKERMLSEGVIKESEALGLFCNVEAIETVNSIILAELEKILDTWNPMTTELAVIFKKKFVGMAMDLYEVYFRNYNHAMGVFSQKEIKPTFVDFVKKCQEEANSIKLESLLITPVQRIPRYEMLIQEIFKYTWEYHPDYELLQDVLLNIQDISVSANKGIEDNENRRVIKKLSRKFVSGLSFKDLWEPGRVFIGDGDLHKVCRKSNKKRHFHLFNDVMVYSEIIAATGRYKAKVKNCLLLDTMVIDDLPDTDKIQNRFAVKSTSKSFVVFASSFEDKSKWMKWFKQCEIGGESSTVAPTWVQDSEANKCQICSKSFTTIRRRHHCRCCGSVVCGSCSANSIHIAKIDKTARVCNDCYVRETNQKPKKGAFSVTMSSSEQENGKTFEPKILSRIMYFLDIEDFSRVPCVCIYWNKVSMDESLWRNLGEATWTVFDTRAKVGYYESFKVKYSGVTKNWKKGDHVEFVLSGHESKISCISAKSNRAVTGDNSGGIRVWNLWKNTLIQEFKAHDKPIRCVNFSKTTIVSGSDDTTLKVWNRNDKTCQMTLRGHKKSVTCVQFSKFVIITGSSDNSVKIWDGSTGKMLRNIDDIPGRVNSLQALFQLRLVATALSSGTIKLWELSRENKCKGSIPACLGMEVRDFYFDNYRMITIGEDGLVKLWTDRIEKTLREGADAICLSVFEDRCIVGRKNGNITIWNIKTSEIMHSINVSKNYVRCIASTGSVLLFSEGKDLICWDYSPKKVKKRKLEKEKGNSKSKSTTATSCTESSISLSSCSSSSSSLSSNEKLTNSSSLLNERSTTLSSSDKQEEKKTRTTKKTSSNKHKISKGKSVKSNGSPKIIKNKYSSKSDIKKKENSSKSDIKKKESIPSKSDIKKKNSGKSDIKKKSNESRPRTRQKRSQTTV